MNIGHAVYQGDIAIIRVRDVSIPPDSNPLPSINGRAILAEGEVTGHYHSVDETVAKLFAASGVPKIPFEGAYRCADKDDRVLVVDRPTTLTHDEHDPFNLDTGMYVIRRQVTLEAGDVRRVLD